VGAIEETIDISRARHALSSGRGLLARLQAGLTQQEVANAVGVTKGCVARWERGETRPRGRAALAYANLLDALEAAAEVQTRQSDLWSFGDVWLEESEGE
jgi:DNA-binding XRE family transcriptional regulator